MRECSTCHKADAPWFTDEPCSCGAYVPHDDDPSPHKHQPDCKCLAHEVVLYPVRMALADLIPDGASGKKLGAYYAKQGWRLLQNGLRWYRVKLLCRECIVLEDQAQERRRDYERACKAARGQDTQTYAQMLASQ